MQDFIYGGKQARKKCRRSHFYMLLAFIFCLLFIYYLFTLFSYLFFGCAGSLYLCEEHFKSSVRLHKSKCGSGHCNWEQHWKRGNGAMGWDGVPLREWKWETLKFLINLKIKFLFVCPHQQKTANDIFQKLSLLYKFHWSLLTPDTMPHVSLHILLVTQCAFDFSVYLPNAINLFSNNMWGTEVRGERSGLYSNNNSIFQFVWFLFGCAYLFAVWHGIQMSAVGCLSAFIPILHSAFCVWLIFSQLFVGVNKSVEYLKFNVSK